METRNVVILGIGVGVAAAGAGFLTGYLVGRPPADFRDRLKADIAAAKAAKAAQAAQQHNGTL